MLMGVYLLKPIFNRYGSKKTYLGVWLTQSIYLNFPARNRAFFC